MSVLRADLYTEVTTFLNHNAGYLMFSLGCWTVLETKSSLAFFCWGWMIRVVGAKIVVYMEKDMDDLHNFKIPKMSGKIPLPVTIPEKMSWISYMANYYAIMVAFIDTVFLMNHGEYSLLPPLREASITRSLMYFIPVSFVAEMIFDVIFYILHRADHELNHRFGGKYFMMGHDLHHRHVFMEPEISYHVHPMEACAEELLLLASFWFVSFFFDLSKLDIALILTYRMWTVLAGHTNKKLPAHSTGFLQCPWLPRLMGIELHSADHNHHHVHVMCNFSARFTFMDKLFGTYTRCNHLLELDAKCFENQQGKKAM